MRPAISPTPKNSVTIAKANANFTEIQAAVDSITDAAADNWYVLELFPGVYVENVVLGNFMTLKGVGASTQDVVIQAASGTTLTMPDIFSTISNINLELLPTASGGKVLDCTAGGDHEIYLTEFRCTSSTNGITAKVLDIDCDSLFLARNNFVYTMLGSSAGANTHDAVTFSGSTVITATDLVGTVVVADVDDDINFFKNASSGNVAMGTALFTGFALNASYSGTFTVFNKTGPGATVEFYESMLTRLIGAGSGTGVIYKTDSSTNDAVVESEGASQVVAGFTTNLFADVATGDTLNRSGNFITAADNTTGAGVVNFNNTTGDAMLILSGGSLFTIDAANEWHAASQLTDGGGDEVSVVAGLTGAITALADAGGGQITVTSASHGLSNGDYLSITGTTNNDDVYQISNVTTNTYEITDTFVATDTGTWHMGSYMEVTRRGRYRAQWNFSSFSAGNNKIFKVSTFKNTVAVAGTGSRRKYAAGGDVGTSSGGGNFSLEKGDRIWLAILNETDNTNFTLDEGSLSLFKIS